MTEIGKKFLKEFLIRLIRDRGRTLSAAISSEYDKYLYSDKIKYTQSKEYWNIVRKGQPKHKEYGLQSELDKLDVWVAKYGPRSKGDPHIAYSANQYGNKREENHLIWSTASNTSPIGYKESISKKDFCDQEHSRIFTQIGDDMLSILVCAYVNHGEKVFESVDFVSFYNDCVKNEITNFDKHFAFIDTYIKKHSEYHSTQKNKIYLTNEFDLTPTGVRKKDFCFGVKDLPEVCEDAVIEAEIVGTGKHTTLIILTNIFPHFKSALGLKVGDTINNSEINIKYKIIRIHN